MVSVKKLKIPIHFSCLKECQRDNDLSSVNCYYLRHMLNV